MSTDQNLELKHRCSDFREVRKVLAKLGAIKDVTKKQKDYFFNLPAEKKKQKGRMKLRVESDRMYVVYYERPGFVEGKDAISDYSILDATKMTLDFLTTSLGVSAVVDKKREVWRLDNTVFHLDTVNNVGGIFEIELQKKGKLVKSDRAKFLDYKTALLPYLGKVIKGSNSDLVQRANLKK